MSSNTDLNILLLPFQNLTNFLKPKEHNQSSCLTSLKICIEDYFESVEPYFPIANKSRLLQLLHINQILENLINLTKEQETIKFIYGILENNTISKVLLSLIFYNEFEKKFKEKNENNVSLKDWFDIQRENIRILSQKDNTFLCFLQLEVCMTLLLQIHKEEKASNHVLQSSRTYVVNRIKWCLSEVKIPVLFEDNNKTGPENFMAFMDVVLQLIEQIDFAKCSREIAKNNLTIARNHIEELLCYALSIIQVALPLDKKIIKANCRKVFNELNELLQECESENLNISLCNLLRDALNNSICSLEQRINTAVLQILLESFKSYDEPIKKLEAMCFSKDTEPKVNRKYTDLDELIINLDLHVDRIIQVGLFAIGCSTHTERVLMMKSCLASLESLEAELVPALISTYLDPRPASQSYMSFLIKHWRSEVRKLQNHIHLIVDPSAFAQLILSNCINNVENLQQCIDLKNNLTAEMVLPMYHETKTLVHHLNVTFPEMSSCLTIETIQNKEKFCKIVNECKSAVDVLLVKENPNKKNSERVFKRCNILVNCLRRLRANLVKLDESAVEGDNDVSFNAFDDISDSNGSSEEISSERTKTFELLLEKSKIIHKERSILYQTPKRLNSKITNSINASYSKNKKDMKHISSRGSIIRSISRLETTLDITDILNQISSSSNSISNNLN